MRVISKIKGSVPSVHALALAILSSLLLAASFPGFEIWVLAWVALVPLILAARRERSGLSRPFIVGWCFGLVFYSSSTWWLTFAPITYAGFPPVLAYALLLAASAIVSVFPGVFALLLSLSFRRFGERSVFLAPFFWTALEFARLWLTGNNWNAIGYSQAFQPGLITSASLGGVFAVGFSVVLSSSVVTFIILFVSRSIPKPKRRAAIVAILAGAAVLAGVVLLPSVIDPAGNRSKTPYVRIVAIQPNVPMSGLDEIKWRRLREKQTAMAGRAIRQFREQDGVAVEEHPVIVVLPESPMNYRYGLDPEFRSFIRNFAVKNDAYVLFNSAEPDKTLPEGLFNSAVMVDPAGRKTAQYDKIYLLPFGEFVPLPEFAQGWIPPMVGRFSQGGEYDLFGVGGVSAGVMICFESHFASLSREYVARGADVILEMTNDGYLGNTPVLRQHLANAVFRAVETRRPVLRITNVGVTALIDERGAVSDSAPVYSQAVRVWQIRRSSGYKTVYVRFGDWFAFICLVVSFAIAVTFTIRPPSVFAGNGN